MQCLDLVITGGCLSLVLAPVTSRHRTSLLFVQCRIILLGDNDVCDELNMQPIDLITSLMSQLLCHQTAPLVLHDVNFMYMKSVPVQCTVFHANFSSCKTVHCKFPENRLRINWQRYLIIN